MNRIPDGKEKGERGGQMEFQLESWNYSNPLAHATKCQFLHAHPASIMMVSTLQVQLKAYFGEKTLQTNR